jgi:Uncharacterized protein conserved in bacteria (DUF2188)
MRQRWKATNFSAGAQETYADRVCAPYAVEKEGISRASSLHDTKESAAMAGRENAINERSELLIHSKDGKIQERNTYKQDPYPPRG